MIFHEESHQVKHLSELDRRSFLKASGVATGLALLSGLLEVGQASAATSVSLPGFAAFSKSVNVTKSSKYYLVESSGIPDHQMMVGIKSWQQQVPTIQPYTGNNAWSIPIKPVISKSPMSAKNHFLRGAIAIAVNGVPIFNALNNRGDDALLAGELDDWGGHCGRADDYHYHIAPLHLQTIVGKKAPIAYALDGYPIYGETEIDGKKVIGLDSFNGHFDSKKNYHYHGTKTYPYVNGGFKGVVSEIDGQVDPQSATKAFREAGAPLRGAVITGLERTGDNAFDLTYSLNNLNYHVKYSATLSQVDMQFVDANGAVRNESYRR
jgi:YHYH protein/TAT (twin-arginine translocation) pathway signal sequence